MQLKDIKKFDRPVLGLLVVAAAGLATMGLAKADPPKPLSPARGEAHDPVLPQPTLEKLRCQRMNAHLYFLARSIPDPNDPGHSDADYGLTNGNSNCPINATGEEFVLSNAIQTGKMNAGLGN